MTPELQTRYLRQQWKLTGLDVVHSGVLGGDYVYEKLSAAQRQFAQSTIQLMGVEDLLGRDVQRLSTGELRKILVARALSASPQVLLCDEICDGLDTAARGSLLAALERVARNGTQLLFTTHRREELLPVLTHQLVLEQGRIVQQTAIRSPSASGARRRGNSPHSNARRPPDMEAGRRIGHWAKRTAFASCRAAGHAPSQPAFERVVRSPDSASSTSARQPQAAARTLICLRRATVFLGGQPVLHNINLEIRAGQHWAVLGPNGSGKTTLLKLMLGDWTPALGGCVRRFAFAPGKSLWEVKRSIGYVSPELHAQYGAAITGEEAIASGFFSSVGLPRQKIPARQWRKVSELVDAFRLHALAGKGIQQMSYGEFRKILIARALVREPELLLCDEPFDGLDAAARAGMRSTLQAVARNGTSLVVVTHHPNELPSCTTHVAELRAGRIVFQGPVGGFSSAF